MQENKQSRTEKPTPRRLRKAREKGQTARSKEVPSAMILTGVFIFLFFAGEGVFVNVAGGLAVGEPVADLGLAVAVASSFRGRPIDPHTVLLGEVGLAGEVRAAQQVSLRAKEADRLGFKQLLLPAGNLPLPDAPPTIKTVGIQTLEEALNLLF